MDDHTFTQIQDEQQQEQMEIEENLIPEEIMVPVNLNNELENDDNSDYVDDDDDYEDSDNDSDNDDDDNEDEEEFIDDYEDEIDAFERGGIDDLMMTSPRVSNSDGTNSDLSKRETDGLMCPICYEAWTNTGDHQICCLPCGHLYGLSCIKKWLQKRMSHGKCPQCNKISRLKGVRVLYVDRLCVADEELFKKVRSLKAKCAHLEQKWSLSVQDPGAGVGIPVSHPEDDAETSSPPATQVFSFTEQVFDSNAAAVVIMSQESMYDHIAKVLDERALAPLPPLPVRCVPLPRPPLFTRRTSPLHHTLPPVITSPRVSKSALLDSDGRNSDLYKSETDGLICSICIEAWTKSGDHQICCLPCGHLYGLSCIKKWLQNPRSFGQCPQCNTVSTLKDVRILYVDQFRVADEELLKKVGSLESKCALLEQKLSLSVLDPYAGVVPVSHPEDDDESSRPPATQFFSPTEHVYDSNAAALILMNLEFIHDASARLHSLCNKRPPPLLIRCGPLPRPPLLTRRTSPLHHTSPPHHTTLPSP